MVFDVIVGPAVDGMSFRKAQWKQDTQPSGKQLGNFCPFVLVDFRLEIDDDPELA